MANSYVTLTAENFDREVLAADRPVLVDFWAAWCPPCRAIAPAIEELAGELAGQATIGKLNVDELPEIGQRFGVRSIPTLLFFRDGKVVDTVVGAVGKEVMRAKLQALSAVA